MIDTAVQIVGAIVLALSLVFLSSEVLARLPAKMTEEHGYSSERFGFWGQVKRFEWTDYRVGYVSDWEVGHELFIDVEGYAQLGEKQLDVRAGVQLFGSLDAYSKSNIIGFARIKDDRADIRLTLKPEQVRDILNELRLNSKLSLHVHGWRGEKVHHLEYFSLTP